MNYESLVIDKENDDVRYNDSAHKYWVKNENLPCISATTLIKRFENFDEDFWSKYKTLEKILQDDFKLIKGDLLKYKKINLNYLKDFNITEEEFDEERKAILSEWEEKRTISCIRGTNIHKQFELGHLAGDTKELSMLNLGGKFPTIRTNKIVPGKGVYSELLLSRISEDKKLRIAGQADLVLVDGNDVYILDYKSSKKIDTKSYFDTRSRKKTMMKYPLNNIEDSNFWHYSLQLSLYAWMIEKVNPDFNIKLLMLIHIDHDNKVTNYECQYLKKDVERMLAFYKQELAHEEFQKSLEKKSWE